MKKRLQTLLSHHNARVNSHQRWKQTQPLLGKKWTSSQVFWEIMDSFAWSLGKSRLFFLDMTENFAFKDIIVYLYPILNCDWQLYPISILTSALGRLQAQPRWADIDIRRRADVILLIGPTSTSTWRRADFGQTSIASISPMQYQWTSKNTMNSMKLVIP